MQLDPAVRSRDTKRGLLIATPAGDTLLLECAAPTGLAEFLGRDSSATELASRIGGPEATATVDELRQMGILVDASEPAAGSGPETLPEKSRNWVLTRSGLEINGIERPARWLHRRVVPVVGSTFGKALIAAIVAGGLISLIAGRPGVRPSVPHRHWTPSWELPSAYSPPPRTNWPTRSHWCITAELPAEPASASTGARSASTSIPPTPSPFPAGSEWSKRLPGSRSTSW